MFQGQLLLQVQGAGLKLGIFYSSLCQVCFIWHFPCNLKSQSNRHFIIKGWCPFSSPGVPRGTDQECIVSTQALCHSQDCSQKKRAPSISAFCLSKTFTAPNLRLRQQSCSHTRMPCPRSISVYLRAAEWDDPIAPSLPRSRFEAGRLGMITFQTALTQSNQSI